MFSELNTFLQSAETTHLILNNGDEIWIEDYYENTVKTHDRQDDKTFMNSLRHFDTLLFGNKMIFFMYYLYFDSNGTRLNGHPCNSTSSSEPMESHDDRIRFEC